MDAEQRHSPKAAGVLFGLGRAGQADGASEGKPDLVCSCACAGDGARVAGASLRLQPFTRLDVPVHLLGRTGPAHAGGPRVMFRARNTRESQAGQRASRPARRRRRLRAQDRFQQIDECCFTAFMGPSSTGTTRRGRRGCRPRGKQVSGTPTGAVLCFKRRVEPAASR
jgi:hypothetical protein